MNLIYRLMPVASKMLSSMSLKQNIYKLFKQPHGLLGSFAGYIMAHRRSNIERNHWTLELLNLKPTDSVLELGFGPGVALQKLARTVTQGMIVGIDHSDVMFAQASKRNADAVTSGLIKLYKGDVLDLPNVEQAFDKIYSANVAQFWDDPAVYYSRLYELLAHGGILATTYMPRHSGATNIEAIQKAKEFAAHLYAAGFKHIEIKSKSLKPVMAVCVVAKKV